uniref:Uncharacterized protein n=1 Tax=Trepomonas sp. PC1 TaxID=1076344 RepID=A0A146K337_9EUKA|eukprot:JAP90294.1 Hypothetical protein TPC1_30211 [Trepomonas sp. PC1]
MDFQQLKTLLLKCNEQYSSQQMNIFGQFAKTASKEDKAEVFNEYLAKHQIHCSFDVDLLQNLRNSLEVILGLYVDLGLPEVKFSQISPQLPHLTVNEANLGQLLLSKYVTQVFLHLPLIHCLANARQKISLELNKKLLWICCDITKFVSSRPDDDFHVDPASLDFNDFLINYVKSDCAELNFVPTQPCCGMDESSSKDQFLIAHLLQFTKHFALQVKNQKVNSDSWVIKTFIQYLTTVNQMPTQEFLLKTLFQNITKNDICEDFYQILVEDFDKLEKRFSLRRKTQNLRDVFSTIVTENVMQLIQKKAVEILDQNLIQVQIQILNVFENLMQPTFEMLLKILPHTDHADWNVTNSVNGLIQKFQHFKNETTLSFEQVEQLQSLKLKEKGRLLRLIVLSKIDITVFDEEQNESIKQFVLREIEQKVENQDQFGGYRQKQYGIVGKRILDKM